MVEVWNVYFLFTTYTTPPKDKYVAVVCVDPEILGFFINSEINQFVLRRPKLLPCIVGLAADQNRYLRHDSFLDCRDAKSFVGTQFHDLRGSVAVESRSDIAKAVEVCPVLRQYDKVRILDAIGEA